MEDKVKIFALGGLNSTGNNLYCVEINEDIFVFAAGCGYPDRYTPGVDFVISDFSYLKVHKDHVKAYFIAHSHDDEFGALPYVYREVPAPIYCTAYTALNINMVSEQRNVVQKYDIQEVDLSCEKIISGHKFYFFRTVHSSPDSYGLAISTSFGNVIFSGDYIIEYTNNKHFKFDFNELNKIAENDTLALLVDSENAERKGYTSPNHRLVDQISKPISECVGKLYVAVYSQNVYNYCEILEACLKSDRLICFFDREAELLFQSLLITGIINIPFNKIIKADDLGKYSSKDVAVIIAGLGELLYQKIGNLADCDIQNESLFIKENDTFILACPAAANFEVLGVDILDELYKTNCTVVEISRKSLAKMHPSEDDIKLLASLLHPKYFIPIKGEYKDLVACANIAMSMDLNLTKDNVFVVDNGIKICFEKNKNVTFKVIDDASVGTVLVDGSGVGDVANEIIDERNKLSTDGVVVISCLVSRRLKQIVGGPDIQMRGYLFVKDSETILKELQNIFVTIVNKHILKGANFDYDACVKEIKDECNRYTKRATARNPVIEPTIVIDE